MIIFELNKHRTDADNKVLGLIYEQTNDLRGMEIENEDSRGENPHYFVPRPGTTAKIKRKQMNLNAQ